MAFVPLIILFCFGAIIASFTTVLTERIYTGQNYWTGRSRCNSCARVLGVIDLIPILSWLSFRGRCRTCRSKIPGLYTIGEAALGTVFAAGGYMFGFTPVLAVFLVFSVVLFFTVIYDLRHLIVPIGSSVALIVLALAFTGMRYGVMLSLPIGLVAAIIALGFFLLYALSRGRAMGLGDTPVAFACALVAGNQAFPGLLYSFWIGALIGIAILVLRRGGPKMGIEVPFVPFLAVGFLLALFTPWNPLIW